MILIISLMLAGVLLGIFVISRDKSGKTFKFFARIQRLFTIFLLFSMGLWLGGNPEFWLNIKTVGIQGFLFAAAAIAGSVIAVFFASKMMTGEKG